MTGYTSPTRRKSTLSEATPSFTKSHLYFSPLANGIRDTTINVATAFSNAGLQSSQQKYTTGKYFSPSRSLSYDSPSHRYSRNRLTSSSPPSKQHPFSLLYQPKQKNSDNISLGRSMDYKVDKKDDSIDNNPFEEEERLALNPMEEQERRRQSMDIRRWSSERHYFTPHQSSIHSTTSSFHSLNSPPDLLKKTNSDTDDDDDDDNDDNDNDGDLTRSATSHPRVQLALKTTAEMALFWIFCLFWAIKEISVYLITLACVVVCTVFLNPVVLILRCLGFRSLATLRTPSLKPPFREGSSGSYGRIWIVSVLMITFVLITYWLSPLIKLSWFDATKPSRTTNKLDSEMMERLTELETTVNDLVKHFEMQDQHNEQQMTTINWHLDQLQHQVTQWSAGQSQELELSLMEYGQKVDQALASTTMDWTAKLEKWETRLEERIKQHPRTSDLIDALRHVFISKSEKDDDMPWSTFLQLHQIDLDRMIQGILDNWIQQHDGKLVNKETLLSQLVQDNDGTMTPATLWIIRGWIDTALERDHQEKILGSGGDYALASRGAKILPLWTSTTFTPSVDRWWTRWYSQGTSISPRAALTPGIHAGQCWPMKGTHGSLGIGLSEPIVVQGITVEYPSRAVMANQVSSAPKQMDIWGIVRLDDLNSAVFLGSVTYQIKPDSTTRQTFDLDNSVVFPGVVVRIRSNWGHQQYTCLYRVRIHGTPVM